MKKLMVMLGAAAMAFGLFALPNEPGISFETDESGVSEGAFTPYGETTGDAGWGTWEGGAIPLQLWATKSESYTYGDGDYARRDAEFDSTAANAQYLNLSTGTAVLERKANAGDKVVDQLVKFTGFDTEPEVTDGKIAVWMSEFENDDESTETNLYVTVGQRDGENVTPIKLKIDEIDGKWELDKWYRLTIKNLGNVIKEQSVDAQAGFVIYVDGEQVKSSDEAATILVDADLTSEATAYMNNGQLFTSITLDNVALNAVGYKGIGGIDDIIIDQDGPAFVQMVTATVAAMAHAKITVTADDKTIAESEVGQGLSFSVAPNTAITIAYTADDDYMFPKDAITSFNETVTASNKEFDNTDTLEAEEIVAWVEDEEYSSLTDAFAAVRALEAEPFESIDVEIVKGGTVTFEEESITFCDESAVTITPDSWTLDGEALTLKANIDAGKKVIDEGALTYSGTVAGALEVGTLTVATDGAIKLTGAGQITTGESVDFIDSADEGFQVKETPGEDDFTYTLEKIPPEVEYVTFTVRVDEDSIAFFTVTTNGADVADAAGTYTVESNAQVKVVATLADGYEDATYTYNNEEFDVADGFKADQASAEVAITATLKTFTVTFKNGDETVDTKKVNWGEKVAAPTAPSKVHATFTGWYNNEVAFDFNTPIKADLTLTAKFTDWLKYEADLYIDEVMSDLKVGLGNGDHYYDKGETVPATAKGVLKKGDKPFITDDSVYYVKKLVLKGTPATEWNFTYDGTTFAAAQGNPEGVTLAGDVLSYNVTTGDNAIFGEVWLEKYEAPAPAPVPVDPSGKNYNTDEEAKDAADAINNAETPAARAALIADPFNGISTEDKTTYAGYVKAVQSGTNVKLALNENGETALSNQVATAVKAINIAGVAGGTAGTATVASPIPGMWYNLVSGQQVTPLSTGAGAKQAGVADAITFTVNKTVGATAEFFSMRAGLYADDVAPDQPAPEE